MPIKVKKIFEKEYAKKGYTKEEADKIFYAHEAKLKKGLRRKK